jgi:hypothetical protein
VRFLILSLMLVGCAATPSSPDVLPTNDASASGDAAVAADAQLVEAASDASECFSGTCSDDCRRRGFASGGVCEDARCVCDEARDAGPDVADACETRTVYTDDDGDGIGAGGPLRIGCSEPLPPRTSLRGDDCDDRNRLTFPGAPERCDGIDSNCDMIADRTPPMMPVVLPRDQTHLSCADTGRMLGIWRFNEWPTEPRCAYRGLESTAPFRPVGSTVCQVCRADSCACWTDPITGGGMSVPCPPN